MRKLVSGFTVRHTFNIAYPQTPYTNTYTYTHHRFQRLIVRPIQDRDAVGFQRLQLLVRCVVVVVGRKPTGSSPRIHASNHIPNTLDRHHALRRVKDMKVRVRGPDGAMVLRPLVALPPKMAEVRQHGAATD